MHWRRKWQPTPAFLPGESQRWGSLVSCHLWGRTESETTEATWRQQQQQDRYYFFQYFYTENSYCLQECGETRTLVHWGSECLMIQPLCKAVQQFLKKSKVIYHIIQQSHFWIYSQKNRKSDSKRYLYILVHSSIIHNNQKGRNNTNVHR